MGKDRVVKGATSLLLVIILLYSTNIFIIRVNEDGLVSELEDMTGSVCGCVGLKAPLSPASDRPAFNLTTCGDSAYRRGDNQRVIAYTYFYQNSSNVKSDATRHYFEGILENLRLMDVLYPGFTMRLYYQVDTSRMEELCNIYCNNSNIDLCPAIDNPRFRNMSQLYPLIWRFLPALDPQVDVFLSRDLDSRLSEREAVAVQEFLQSQSMIHVMRDNPNHGTSIMGGMWGARLNATLRIQFKESFRDMFKDPVSYANRTSGGWDQIALKRYVWPWGKKMAYVHDSYTCRRFSYTHPFTTKRLLGVGNYVGSIVSLNATVRNKCPYKCRPKEHKDWSYC